jgi:hypothetical protein
VVATPYGNAPAKADKTQAKRVIAEWDSFVSGSFA